MYMFNMQKTNHAGFGLLKSLRSNTGQRWITYLFQFPTVRELLQLETSRFIILWAVNSSTTVMNHEDSHHSADSYQQHCLVKFHFELLKYQIIHLLTNYNALPSFSMALINIRWTPFFLIKKMYNEPKHLRNHLHILSIVFGLINQSAY